MKTVEIVGQVDAQRRLSAQVPLTVAPGPVKVALLVPEDDEDEGGQAWQAAIAGLWADAWNDPREDIYTPDDGEPVDDAR